IVVANNRGYAIRFPESKVRAMGRNAAGVKAMTLKEDTNIIGFITIKSDESEKTILVLSEKGMGKRSALEDYRVTNRGGKGVKTMQITEKTGNLIAIKTVTDYDDLIITTKNGVIIRTPVNSIRVMGRATQGVKIINLDSKDKIADISVIFGNKEDKENNEEE
ncbi:MAG TPA: DNA gyrase subunit A, partial [Bacteroidetes bacterium]|nr:DNA gyrase subunit A [Bacteroidota bacterium]